MSPVERVLQELECATAIAAAPAQDLGAVRESMDRRQLAIADLARLTGALSALSQEQSEDVLRRLRLASDAGAQIEQRLASVKTDIMAEWKQWSHIYRALGAASAAKTTHVDYRG